MATNLIVRQIKKGKSKSTKEKNRHIPPQPDVSISTPSKGIVKQPGEGLYVKLMQVKNSINSQLKEVGNALVNGHDQMQYTSRHQKNNSMTSVVTMLLLQLDSAVTTTHHCLTTEIMEKNNSFRPRLNVNEKQMFENIASLVKWVDFDSKLGEKKDPEKVKYSIGESIKRIQYALEEMVRLVYEALDVNSTATSATNTLPSDIKRRASDDMVHVHPALSALKNEGRDRKISWSPGSSTTPPPTSTYRVDGLSESSSTSDEDRRRSGSVERIHNSPEYTRNSVSPDWDSRNRSTTVPIETAAHHGHGSNTASGLGSVQPAVRGFDFPPLPGEQTDFAQPPPLPKKGEFEDARVPPPPMPHKGHTLPRMSTSDSTEFNGWVSPEGGPIETPPPVPVKKRGRQVNGHGHPSKAQSDGSEVPPPIPVKQRHRSAALGSPQHTSSLTHSIATSVGGYATAGWTTTGSRNRESGSSDVTDGGGAEELPPVPMRMESIPGVKSALVQDTPPPKPPRTDVSLPVVVSPRHVAQPRHSIASRTPQQEEVFNAVRKYNEDIIKARESGPDVAPPIPLKKKTIMVYKGLLQGYTFDESLMQPFYIPDMEAPPPLPPKKRRRKKQAEAAVTPSVQAVSDSSQSKCEEVEDTEDVGDVNYLELEDASSYLIFFKEDGGYTLRGGPIDALIAYAASSTKAVKHFSEAFLLTYYTFITPEELISKLLNRLEYFYKTNTASIWQASTSLLVRVLTGLNKPLMKEAQIKLIDMVHTMISDGNLKFAQLLRNALVEKLNQLLPEKKIQLTLGEALRNASGKSSRKLVVMDFSPDDIAKQMTILDNELFQKVDVCEMLYWAKEQNEEKSPMLTQFTMHFNNVSQWTKVQLLKRGIDMKTRVKIILHFINIMKCLRENHNNFNSYLAILSAIESSPISRLDWPDKVLKGLEAPRQLIDNRGSFKNYREAFAGAKPPCIPYIGLYLQDLTFIEMQPSKLEEDLQCINFTKRWKQFKSVDHIRFAQTKQYNYQPDPEILSLFANFETDETDEDLWSISHGIKPSARAQRT